MVSYLQEQFIVILTTTLSLLTAWSWNSVLRQYVNQYYGDKLSTKIIFAVIVTVTTFLLINWLLRYLSIQEQDLEKAKKVKLSKYVVNGGLPQEVGF